MSGGPGPVTAATRVMLAEAFVNEHVTVVVAYTLAECNASNRVLEKTGFGRDAGMQQAGDMIWRFSFTHPADS